MDTVLSGHYTKNFFMSTNQIIIIMNFYSPVSNTRCHSVDRETMREVEIIDDTQSATNKFHEMTKKLLNQYFSIKTITVTNNNNNNKLLMPCV